MRKLLITEMNRLTVEEFKEKPKIPLVVVLDDVRSLYNVGSIFRTCDAFRVEALWLTGITACPPHVEIHKTALGAQDSVSWQYFSTAILAVEKLKEEGYEVLAIEQCQGSTLINSFKVDRSKKYAIIFGNEVKGVNQEVINLCVGSIEIPQFGTKHSLNVSVTAGIILWKFAKEFLLD